jgi:hypothetical protein
MVGNATLTMKKSAIGRKAPIRTVLRPSADSPAGFCGGARRASTMVGSRIWFAHGPHCAAGPSLVPRAWLSRYPRHLANTLSLGHHGRVPAPAIAVPVPVSADELRRRELAAFLRSRRQRISPEQVGMSTGGRRRTPGLRREEVAQLAPQGLTGVR